MIYRLDDLIESHDFEHDQKFVKAEHWKDACDELEDKSKTVQWLQAENAKLRECVKFYGDAANNPTQYMRQGYLVYNLKKKIFIDGGERARQVLKELGDK